MKAFFVVIALCMAGASAVAGKLELTWSMKRVGGELRIDYTIRNGTAKRVVIVDQLYRGAHVDQDAIIVMNARGLAKTVAFVRAFVVDPKKEFLERPEPDGRIVGPGETVKGSATTEWPLRSWHNFDNDPAPLRRGATKAVLEIGYIEEPFTMDGNTPDGDQKLLRGKVRALPRR